MDDLLRLSGCGRARLTPIDRSRGTAGLTRLYGAARLTLAPDRRALLVPAVGHLADDLVPWTGSWGTDGELRVGRTVDEFRAVELFGRLSVDREGAVLEGRHTMVDGEDVHVHDVHVEWVVGDTPRHRSIGGVPVPVTLAGSMSGVCAGERFGPSAVELSLTDPATGDRPMEVLLSSVDHVRTGAVLWLSGATGLSDEDIGRYVVDVRDGIVTASADSDTDAALGITFDVPMTPPLVGMSPVVVPVAARRARLRFQVATTDGRVRASGRLQLSGTLPDRSVEVDATVDAAGELATGVVPDPAGFDLAWHAAAGSR